MSVFHFEGVIIRPEFSLGGQTRQYVEPFVTDVCYPERLVSSYTEKCNFSFQDWMGGWMNVDVGWMDGWMNDWTDGRMECPVLPTDEL